MGGHCLEPLNVKHRDPTKAERSANKLIVAQEDAAVRGQAPLYYSSCSIWMYTLYESH